MRICEIKIENYRQYECLELKFPKNTKHDLHIIVADNGVGKTNILNAITWCMYGDEPHLGNANKSLPKLNLAAKRKTEDSDDKMINISVKINVEDDGEMICFCRTMSISLMPTYFEQKDQLQVSVVTESGDTKIFYDDEACIYVDKYTPRKIRQYFYFDGEQLESYFISDESSKIKQTVHAISQVDIVTRVKERLSKIVTSKRGEAGKNFPKIKIINAAIEEQKKLIKNIETEIIEINKQITTSKLIINENTERLSGQDNLPDIEANFQEITARKKLLEENQREQLEELFVFAREKKIDLSFYKIAKQSLDIIKIKELNNALPPEVDKKMLIRVKDSTSCSICGQHMNDEAKKYLDNLINQIQVSSETSNILMSIKSELIRIVESVDTYAKDKEKYLKSYKLICEDLKDTENKLQDLDNKIAGFSDRKLIRGWHEERAAHEILRNTNEKKLGMNEFRLKESIEMMNMKLEELNKELSKEKECKNIKKMVDFTINGEKIVELIESEMMNEVKFKMQERTLYYFNNLMWKKGIYNGITLDEQYQLDLLHKDGYSCVGSCSAAERSLLALSFTLALHEVSGFNSLLFIDTPVARVTGQNRINFAEVLKEVSTEKQLIMTFTPDEFSESIKNVFAPVASTNAKLIMNSEDEVSNLAK